MSGWDRDELVNAACPCGTGRIIYTCLSPNHSYGGVHYEAEITCATCKGTYSLRRRGYESLVDVVMRLGDVVVQTHKW